MILKDASYAKESLIIKKKVSTTKILEKLKIMIITQEYPEVLHILCVILDTVHKEIYLL